MTVRASAFRTITAAVVAAVAVGIPQSGAGWAVAYAEDEPAGRTDLLTPALREAATPGQQSSPSLSLPETGPGSLLTTRSGRLLVDVRLSSTDDSALTALRGAGARITFVADEIRTVTVAIDPEDLDGLAGLAPLVESVQEVQQPVASAACPTGPTVSEGFEQLRADLARTQFAVQGRDVTVGILSDTYNVLGGAAADTSNGDLPGGANPCGNTQDVGVELEGPLNNGADEGRAMAQIVHDIAPKAKILFASAFYGEAAFAQSIRDLAAAGADIIVDDIIYFAEPMYQDGLIAKAVADVSADGVVYFSAAGNFNEVVGGNDVGSYEAPAFRPSPCPGVVSGTYAGPVQCHDFNAAIDASDATYEFTMAAGDGPDVNYQLGWSEPQFGVTTDLDLCVTDPLGSTLVGCLKANSLTTQKAFESISLNGPAGSYGIVLVRGQGTGTPRLKMVSTNSRLTAVQYSTSTGGDVVGPTAYGHNASRPGVTVAAVPFDNAAVAEPFSSRGPATYCWGPVVDTQPATATPCETSTVDLAATDGVQNSFFGDGGDPFRFYGTSAAAPHAAAVAALLLDREQCLTRQQVLDALQSTGQSVGSATADTVGSGLVDARAALEAAGAANCDTTPPQITVTAPDSPNGWYRTPSVVAAVAATDRRTVTALNCTDAALTAVEGIGSTRATGTATVTGEGVRTLSCSASDAENNAGAASGSSNTATIRIDTIPPAITCRPTSVPLDRARTMTGDVSDAGSGPSTATVSVTVPTDRPGTFDATLTASDVAGNSTQVSCPFTVVARPKIVGPGKAAMKKKRSYVATGFPGQTAIRWTVTGKKKRPRVVINRTTDISGVSVVKIRFAQKGKTVVRATAGGVSASRTVRVK